MTISAPIGSLQADSQSESQTCRTRRRNNNSYLGPWFDIVLKILKHQKVKNARQSHNITFRYRSCCLQKHKIKLFMKENNSAGVGSLNVNIAFICAQLFAIVMGIMLMELILASITEIVLFINFAWYCRIAKWHNGHNKIV